MTGNEDSTHGRLVFHEYVVSRSGESRDYRVSGGEIAAVRNAERRRQGPTVEMRSPYLTAERAVYETLLVPEAHVRFAFDGDTEDFLRLVSKTTGVSVQQMRSSFRDRHTVSARRAAVSAWRTLNRSTSEIAASLSISAPAATQLVRRNADRDSEAKRNSELVVAFCKNVNK